MDEKDKRIKELEDLLFKALARIEELERRLGLNSSQRVTSLLQAMDCVKN